MVIGYIDDLVMGNHSNRMDPVLIFFILVQGIEIFPQLVETVCDFPGLLATVENNSKFLVCQDFRHSRLAFRCDHAVDICLVQSG